MTIVRALYVSVFVGFIAVAHAADDSLLFEAPKLDGIEVDGNRADWTEAGLHIGLLTTVEGDVKPPADFDTSFWVGWDEGGLLLLLDVRDDDPVEAADIPAIATKDAVEIFVASGVGAVDYYQVAIAPGRTEEQDALRHHFSDFRNTEPKPPLEIEAARTITDTGYVLEVRLPWQNLAYTPGYGDEVGLQLFVNDVDDESRGFKVKFYPWRYDGGTYPYSFRMHRVRLAHKGGPDTLAKAVLKGGPAEPVTLEILAVEELAGSIVKAKAGGKTLGRGRFEAADGRARCTLTLTEYPDPSGDNAIALLVGRRQVGQTPIDGVGKARARALVDAAINFSPCVFRGNAFPKCEFDDPHEAEKLLGEYTIQQRFYDNEYNEVTAAEKPGRYGAVIDIVPAKGRPLRRFRTLLRLPDAAGGFGMWFFRPELSMTLPDAYGIAPDVLAEHFEDVKGYVWRAFTDSFKHDPQAGALMAALYHAEPTGSPVRQNERALALDRQWWVGLKRKIYGTDAMWPEPFVCPRPVEGPPAPVLRKGTEKEAGFKPGAAKRIDALLKDWAADSDQAFAVCVARNGVAILHEAYGERDGAPMTVTTKSWMASTTKLLSGILMWMCVDQGRVDPDDPVDKYLPALRDIEVEQPLTVHRLYTHTNGLWGHWGDDMNDLEEVVAGYYPYLNVGVEHVYNGTGYALGGKVIEAASGEAIPEFFLNHLLNPLGCPNTDAVDTNARSVSTPMDLAKIGQMLLNGGAYGDMRFFSEETMQKVMPAKLTGVLEAAEAAPEWGIGVVFALDAKGFSKRTFGHGAASAATFYVDPDNKLVVTMTRNSAGRNFGKYHDQFKALIMDNLVDPAPVETF